MHPCASASIPFSVIKWHQEMLISKIFYKKKRIKIRFFKSKEISGKRAWLLTGHPSDKAFMDKSVINEHDSNEIAVNLGQFLLNGSIAASVIFLHSVRSKCSILWQCCASVRIDWSPTLWHPFSDKYLRNPPQRCEMFSMTGP